MRYQTDSESEHVCELCGKEFHATALNAFWEWIDADRNPKGYWLPIYEHDELREDSPYGTTCKRCGEDFLDERFTAILGK